MNRTRYTNMNIRKAHTNDEGYRCVNMHNFDSFFLNNTNQSNRLLLTRRNKKRYNN